MDYRYRVILTYVTVIFLAVLLSAFIFLNNRQLTHTNEQLFNQTLPQLDTITRLKEARLEHERLLYEYYATSDTQRLQPRLSAIRQQINQGLLKITRHPMATSTLGSINDLNNTLKTNADLLDKTLAATLTDWDRARELLMIISQVGRDMEPLLNRLAAAIADKAAKASQAQQQRSQLGTELVIGFCLTITTIALLVGFYIDRYIRETAERKRLAMFAERNPSPVLSTRLNGEILYQNPATTKLLLALERDNGQAASLLPEGFSDLIKNMARQNRDRHTGTLKLDDLTLKYSMALLADLRICHIHFDDITEQTQAQAALKFQAFHSPLTQLPNRRSLELKLSKLLSNTDIAGSGCTPKKQSAPNSTQFDLLLINIYHFDRIIALHGHQLGEHLIQQVALRLQQSLDQFQPTCDARSLFGLEGTTFGVLIPSTDHQQTLALANHLYRGMQPPVTHIDNEFYLNLRIGISGFPRDGHNIVGLFKAADSALMQAKQDGSVHIQFYDHQIQQREQHLNNIESRLRQADSNSELTLFYQPKVDANSGRVTGAEALMRWLRDGRIVYSPAEFIPVAEQSGLIIHMGAQALETAIQKACQWRQKHPVNIAVNLSCRQFQHASFLPHLQELLQRYPGAEQLIELEITESLLMQDMQQSIAIMHKLKGMGFHLSIDDFGTGYSSLSYLKEFPIDKLKIDQSFIKYLETNPDDQVLVQTIISLAHSLGLTTIAEGVENLAQLTLLQAYGCEEIQGYYFSKPLPAAEFQQHIIEPMSRQQAPILAAQIAY